MLRFLSCFFLFFTAFAYGVALSEEELAKIAQNPLANVISIPFQNNTYFQGGADNGITTNVLNIQPVIPISLTEDWTIITRTIIPIISTSHSGSSGITGLGNIQFSSFLSPKPSANGIIWGVGGVVQLPTATDLAFTGGAGERWGLGPTAVILQLREGNPWVYGVLANVIWSVGDTVRFTQSPFADNPYSTMLIQPFLNYNFDGGWYVSSVPIITVNWLADQGQQWTVPVGGNVGKIVYVGKLPLNLSAGGYYNVVRPTNGSIWSVRISMQVLLPKALLF